MNKLELDDGMVAGNGDVGQRTAVATLMPPAATHVPVASTMGAAGGLFTAAQWVELQWQSLIYNHMAASSPIPSYLLFSNINPAAAAAAPTQAPSSCYCCYNTPLLVHHYQAQQAAQMSMLLQCMQQAVARRRCGRTDGKKWRCARDAEPDQKYCQRHLNRVGRTRPPPPARKQQHQHAAAAVDAHHRDRNKTAMTASAATHTSHGNKSSGNAMREDDDDYSRGLLDFTGGVCLPEQRENRLSLNYDNIAELYCNRQVAATPTAPASAAASATAMDDDAIDHGAAATWVGIGGPLGEALGLAVEIQWPAGST
ncbi:growth-regulating factor 6-like [Aegilops tauschii subsp. strangulata]|nr:growth-regulating factor 6-like [Aegilops tauschii subsp. strangulata]XP_044416490.1 growth-regulating factor 6-like [Triticum aestivum]